jgi:hypothetical protein
MKIPYKHNNSDFSTQYCQYRIGSIIH